MSDSREYTIATKPCVSPNKPPNPYGLLSVDFPMPRPGKDRNSTALAGRTHTGVWQLSRAPDRHLDAPVSSRATSALPNGYSQAQQFHGRPEIPGGQRWMRHGIGQVHSARFNYASVQPAELELSAYTREHGASVFGTWANATGPILTGAPAPAPAGFDGTFMSKQRATGSVLNSPTKGYVAPGAPPLSPSAMPSHVDAMLAAERFSSMSARGFASGYLPRADPCPTTTAPLPLSFRTGYVTRVNDAKASDFCDSVEPPLLSLHPTQAALRALHTPFDFADPRVHKTARLHRGM